MLIQRDSKYHFFPPYYYKSLGIDYIKGSKVKKLESASTKSNALLENDLKIPFHISLLSTGSSKQKKKYKLFNMKNWFIADSIFDKIEMKKKLKD